MVKGDLMALLTELFSGTTHLDRINYLHVALIPKRPASETTGDFRPICQRNSTVKIIVKALANRLKKVSSERERTGWCGHCTKGYSSLQEDKLLDTF